MELVELQNVTIISERFLKDDIIRIIKNHNAKGYTLTDVSGEGSRGIRASEWEGKNVKIETVVSAAAAERIIQAISDHYFENYAVIAYTQPVSVVRGKKYI